MNITAYKITDLGSGNIAIESSSGAVLVSSSLQEILDFLRYSSSKTIRVFFDLDDSIAPVLRMMSRDHLDSVIAKSPTVEIAGSQVTYYPGHLFQVGKSRFYSLKHFYGLPEYTLDYTLEETQASGEELLSTLSRMGMGDAYALVSAVSCFRSTTLGKAFCESLPKGYDIPPSCFEALDYADAADHKDWVEARQIGHWPSGCFDWDLTGCYSWLSSKLYDLRDLEYWKSSHFGPREQGAAYGFLRGSFKIYPDGKYAHCSPIIANIINDLPGNPVGNLPPDTYTLDEVRTVEMYGIGEFAMQDGWFMKPAGSVRPRLPFKDMMNNLYQLRAMSPLASSIAKGIGNQLIGWLIRRAEIAGSIKNEIYHALITAGARCEITKFLVENDVQADEVVSVQTDGVRITKDIPHPRTSGLGAWRCNGDYPTIVMSPRKVYCRDKRPYRITYDDILNMVSEKPGADRYAKSVPRHTTLEQAKEMGDVYRVGEYGSVPAGVDILGMKHEQNRVFKQLPRIGSDLLNKVYKSEPVLVEY